MTYNQYSNDIREMISITKDENLYSDLNIPRSTARYWTNNHIKLEKSNEVHLKAQIHQLENQIEKQNAMFNALKVVFNEFVSEPGRVAVPKAKSKERILRAIDKARKFTSLVEISQITGITKGRYQRWKNRELQCCLDDYSKCPRTFPHQLTKIELEKMKQLFYDPKLSHYSIPSLALYAQKTKKIFCSESTWKKYSKKLGWVRPGKRHYPPSRRVGIKAAEPNELWHMDLSVYNLPGNKKLYIQAIIDNYSKYIVGWNVSEYRRSIESAQLLRKALSKFKSSSPKPTLFVDDGTENKNKRVERVLKKNNVRLITAQIDVSFSNSKIEAFFRDLKNNYLYKKNIRTKKDLKKFLDFYINEHNHKIPQASFKGGTPAQVYKGIWGQQNIDRLRIQIKKARVRRYQNNRRLKCAILELNQNFAKMGL